MHVCIHIYYTICVCTLYIHKHMYTYDHMMYARLHIYAYNSTSIHNILMHTNDMVVTKKMQDTCGCEVNRINKVTADMVNVRHASATTPELNLTVPSVPTNIAI